MGNIVLLLLAPGLLLMLIVLLYGLVRVVIPQAISDAKHSSVKKSIEDKRNESKEECDKLVPLIVNETRDFINKVRTSRSFDILKRVFLRDGAPFAFSVHDDYIICYDHFGRECRRILFSDCKMPTLSMKRLFPEQIDGCWVWGWNSSEMVVKVIKTDNPDLFGLSTYDKGSYDYEDYRPCINEFVVIGVLLCQSTGRKYTSQSVFKGLKFTRVPLPSDPSTDPWQ